MMASTGMLAALDVMHVIRADLPEEGYLLLETAMRFASTGEQCWQPFREWQETADQGPAYDYYLTLLQVLDSQHTGARWLMKNPSHLANVERLIERFPDVRIVWTHRDPIAATASLCSLLWFAMQALADVDKFAFCAALADGCVMSVTRAMDVRDRLGDGHFVDIDYRDLAADPAATADRVARSVGLPISEETSAAFRRYSDENRQDRHGVHVYDLTQSVSTAPNCAPASMTTPSDST